MNRSNSLGEDKNNTLNKSNLYKDKFDEMNMLNEDFDKISNN